MAQRAGATVWHCRVQAALLLKRTPEYADTNLICPLMSSAVAAVEASARRSCYLSTAAWPSALAQGSGIAECRRLCCSSVLPEYADTNLICPLVSSAVAAVEASARRSVICPEQHGPARWRKGLALPSAGGFAAQAYARICRYQPDMSFCELSSRCCRSISP